MKFRIGIWIRGGDGEGRFLAFQPDPHIVAVSYAAAAFDYEAVGVLDDDGLVEALLVGGVQGFMEIGAVAEHGAVGAAGEVFAQFLDGQALAGGMGQAGLPPSGRAEGRVVGMGHTAYGLGGAMVDDGLLAFALLVGELEAGLGQAQGILLRLGIKEVHPIALNALIDRFVAVLPDSFQGVALMVGQVAGAIIGFQQLAGGPVAGQALFGVSEVVVDGHQKEGIVQVLPRGRSVVGRGVAV